MVKIYIPVGAENKLVKEEQERLVSKMVGEGWRHMGIIFLKDFFGGQFRFVVLERQVDEFGNYKN